MGQRGARKVALVALALFLPALAARAQFASFHVGNTQPFYDETGTNALWGNAQLPGCYVQILRVLDTNNPYVPPFNPDGTVNTSAVLIAGGEARIGNLAAPAAERPGTFGKSINENMPAGSEKLFVRVFNAATPFDATYYGDSQLYDMNGSDFDAVIGATSNSLDGADTDSDGLNDRWERFYGTDTASPDSDGDGVGDYEEHRAGTDALDNGKHLAVGTLQRAGSGLTIAWESVPGRDYQVEFTDSLTEEGEEFYPIAIITASDTTTQYEIPFFYVDAASRQFRVVVLDE